MYKNRKTSGKTIISFIAILMSIVLVLGGLGYVTKGWMNWNAAEWYQSILDTFNIGQSQEVPEEEEEIPEEEENNLAALPLTVEFDDLTKETVTIEGRSVYAYYKDFEGQFDFQTIEALKAEIIQSTVQLEYVRSLSEFTILDNNSFYLYINDDPLFNQLLIILVPGMCFDKDVPESPLSADVTKSTLIIMYANDTEKELISDFSVSFSGTSLTALSTPSNVSLLNTDYIIWDEVPGTEYYVVNGIGDSPININYNQLNISTFFNSLGSGTYNITVQAVPYEGTEYKESAFSEPFIYEYINPNDGIYV